MMGEGLLHYGDRKETVDLVTRIMTGIIENLKREHSFRKHYHAERSQGVGERNALAGLPPLGLFLASLGVRILSPWKVFLHGSNKYPWPVRLKYRGMVIECNPADTLITFPDGQQVIIDDPEPCIIEGTSREESA
jgi:hypothetical protein